LQPAGDFGFTGARTVELSYLRGLEGRSLRPSQALSVLAGVGKAGPNSFPQNLPFELGKNGQQGGHSSTGGCRQIQGFGQRDEADTQMLQFLQGCQQVGY